MGWFNWFKKEKPPEKPPEKTALFEAVLVWQLGVQEAWMGGPRTDPRDVRDIIVPYKLEHLLEKGIDTVEKFNVYVSEQDTLRKREEYRCQMYTEMLQKKLDDEIDEYILWKEKGEIK